MKLIQYYNLLNKRLKSIIEEKELEEYFFWLIKHYCEIRRSWILRGDQKCN